MTLEELIRRASAVYSDDLIYQYYKEPDEKHGDNLAKFIMHELSETFDADASEQTQIAEATRVLQRAMDDLEDVMLAIEGSS